MPRTDLVQAFEQRMETDPAVARIRSEVSKPIPPPLEGYSEQYVERIFRWSQVTFYQVAFFWRVIVNGEVVRWCVMCYAAPLLEI